MKQIKSKKPLTLSIVIPVYNPRSDVGVSFRLLKDHTEKLIKVDQISDWEVIIVDNGCTDNTTQKLRQLKKNKPDIAIMRTNIRGIGLALKAGLSKTKGDLIYFTSVDHPFKFDDLDKFLNIIDQYDLVFASKNHPGSIYRAPIKRKIASYAISNIIRPLFNLSLTDTQGTFIIKKEALKTILPFCNSPGPFFQAQLAINAKKFDLRISEIPVNYQTKSGSSSFSLFRDGYNYLCEATKERFFSN